jgi:hypothetical protein
MKIINLWLSEYPDYTLLKESKTSTLINVLVHNSLLHKIRVSNTGQFCSPLHWVNKNDLEFYGKNKIKWGFDTKAKIADAIANTMNSKDSGAYSLAIERLLFHGTKGCMDALIFASSCSRSMDEEFNVRIIVGGEYRVTELVALIWWISACEVFFPENSIEFLFVSRNNDVCCFKSANELLNKMSQFYSVDPRVTFKYGSEKLNFNKEVNLWWTGSLPNPTRWKKFIEDKSVQKNLPVLRAAQRNRCGDGNLSSSCLEICSSNGDSDVTMRMLFNEANKINKSIQQKNLYEVDIFKSYSNGVLKYFCDIVPDFFCAHLYAMISKIDNEIKGLKISSFFSINAPLLESIALHIYIARRGILPFLLPHSYTTSYEYPSSTYINSFTFINSNLVLNKLWFHQDKDSIANEIVLFSGNYPLAHSSFRSLILNKLAYVKKIFLLYSFFNIFKESLHRFKELSLREYNSFIYGLRISRKKIRIGFILNYEHYEFSMGLDFSELFNLIDEMSSVISHELGAGSCLNVRAKPGYTNISLLKKHIGKDNLSFILSPNKKSLLDYGDSCDVVLFLQGTSAIPELMEHGTPCVYLGETTGVVQIEPQYINMPTNIVPVLSLNSVMEYLQQKPDWFSELGVKQSEWILQQMKESGPVE